MPRVSMSVIYQFGASADARGTWSCAVMHFTRVRAGIAAGITVSRNTLSACRHRFFLRQNRHGVMIFK